MDSQGPPTILPDDLILEILLKLPMKDLVRFRRVCKSWQYLITSPDSDIVFHHRNSSLKQNIMSNPHNQFLLLRNRSTNAKPELQIRLLLSKLREILAEHDGLIQIHRLIFKDGEICLAGCCDGLLCFVKDSSDVFICNPVLDQVRALPKSEFHHERWIHRTVFSFFYDDHSNDFKVVKIMSGNDELKVEVHSLRSNSWKTFGPAIPRSHMLSSPMIRPEILVHSGRIYLLVDGIPDSLMILDVNKEEVRVIPMPEDLGSNILNVLFLFQGSISVSSFLFTYMNNSTEVWVLEDDANDNDNDLVENARKKFWTKKSVLPENCPSAPILPYLTTGVTMGATETFFPSSTESSKFLCQCLHYRSSPRETLLEFVVADYIPSLVSVTVPVVKDPEEEKIARTSSTLERIKRVATPILRRLFPNWKQSSTQIHMN